MIVLRAARLVLAVGAIAFSRGAVAQEPAPRVQASARTELSEADREQLALARDVLDLAAKAREAGDLEPARDAVGEALEVLGSIENREAPEALEVVSRLDEVSKSLGLLETQLVAREWIVEVRARTLSPEDPWLLTAQQRLANTRSALGDLEGARELEEHVHEVWERLRPPDDLYLLIAKQNLSATRYRLGDFEGARALEEQVHGARERTLPHDDPELLGSKLNLAAIRYRLGDLEGAHELEEYVHEVRERTLSPDHMQLLDAKQNLAMTCSALGDLEAALVLEEYVHEARARLLPPEHIDLINAKLNLATTRKRIGDLEGALVLEEQVYEAWKRLLPHDHRDLLEAEANLAETAMRLGDLDRAHVLTRALVADQLFRATTLRSESPRVARAGALLELGRLPKALLLSEATASETETSLDAELFSVLENLRRVSTSSSEVALAAARSPELRALRDRLVTVRAELTDLSLAAPAEASQVESWHRALFELADDRDGLERELRTQLAERGVFSGTITSADVGRALGSGSAAISYFRYPREFAADPETGEAPPALDSLLAFVVRPDGSVTRVELGPSSELDELCTRWRERVGKPLQRGVVVDSSGDTEEEAGEALRQSILDPCLAALGADLPRRLHVVLDDFMHLVPIDALPWEDGKRVGEVVQLRVEVSLQRLVAPPMALSGTGTLVALGGANFGAEGIEAPGGRIATEAPPVSASNYRSSAPESFISLKQSQYEVQLLGDQFRELVGGEPIVLMKEKATKNALVELAPGARYLHLATHGWFASEVFPSMRDGADGERDSASLARMEESVRVFAPETLCGLALAGANHGRNALGQVPGILTAEELATLDLAGCELAVLSACETNVGIRRAGQGIQSLQGALHAAGARTAITSLWVVDDAATRRLMELFYTKLWEEKLGKAEALWRAKMELRVEGNPVSDWAGWVLTGDPD